jgi:hypothetical protein
MPPGKAVAITHKFTSIDERPHKGEVRKTLPSSPDGRDTRLVEENKYGKKKAHADIMGSTR